MSHFATFDASEKPPMQRSFRRKYSPSLMNSKHFPKDFFLSGKVPNTNVSFESASSMKDVAS